MTVTTNTNKVQALGTGATKTFPYSFRIYSASELVVTSTDLTAGVDTTLVLNTDYTVTGAGSYDGGNVVLTGDAPPATTRITIRRVIPVTQGTDLRNQGAYFAETHEDVFDKLTMIAQQQGEEIDRSFKLRESSSGVSSTLPSPAARRALLWNADSNALENSTYDPDAAAAEAAASANAAAASASSAASSAADAAEDADAADTARIAAQEAQAAAEAAVGAPADGSVTLAKLASLTTKGDILVHTGAAHARVPVGTAGRFLVTDPNDGNGVAWGPRLLRGLDGFDPDKLSTNVIRFYPGWCANSNGHGYALATSSIDVNMAVNGLNGLDTGTPTDGVGYFPYVIKNETTGAVGIVISSSIIYGGVVLPTGYSVYRKLPFGFVYNSTRDGIPNFHLSYWPKPFIRFTDAGEDATYRALASGTATAWAEINLSAFIPDNARMAYLYFRTSATGTNGKAQVRTVSTSNGLSVGDCLAGGVSQYHTLHIRITSDMKIYYQVTGGASLTVFVLGYSMTEPS